MAQNKFIIEVKAKGFGDLKDQVKRSDDALTRFGNNTRRQRRATKGLERGIGSIRNTMLLYAFAVGAASKATSVFIRNASKFQDVKTRLIGLTGSVVKANKAFDTFNAVAATTPFTLDDVVNAGAQLKAFGADAEALIKPITDLAAFMGTTATEAANSFGRAFAGGAGAADILRERGILNIIKSSQGIADLSKTTLPEFREALISAIQDPVVGIEGSTDRLSKTTTGALSNMGDAYTRLAAVIGDKLKPVTDATIKSMTKLAEGTIDLIDDETKTRAQVLIEELGNLEKEFNLNEKAIKTEKKAVMLLNDALDISIANSKALFSANSDFIGAAPELQAALIKENSSRVTQNNLLETNKERILDRTNAILIELAAMEQVNTARNFEADVLQRITDLLPQVTTSTINLMTVQNQMKELKPLDPIDSALKALDPSQKAAVGMTKRLSDTFVQAGINGQDMGQAVITSLKSIAAEIAAQAITFGLLKSFFAPQSLGFGLTDFIFKGFGVAHQGGPVQKFSGGGVVQGMDNVPILAQAGEFVIKRDSAQSIGLDALTQMNESGQATSNINVHIHGGVVQEDYVRNELIPAINRSGARVA